MVLCRTAEFPLMYTVHSKTSHCEVHSELCTKLSSFCFEPPTQQKKEEIQHGEETVLTTERQEASERRF